MELDKITLENWLEKSETGYTLSGKLIKFFSLYETLKKFLLPKHEETTKGAIIESIDVQIKELKKKGDEDLFKLEKIRWLNDHGPRHIDTVIERASQMLNTSNDILSPREVFCLLSAIQLHDIGNFYGRIGHEKKIMDIVGTHGATLVGSDHIERRHILHIAQAHGGKVEDTGNKDTISVLKNETPVLNDIIRLRLIAAIVRFADELADDRFRADIELLKQKKLPKSSEVYHAYSACLNSVIINHNNKTIELHFDIDKEYLKEKFGKDNGEIYLIDEIYSRVLKMHQERIYCSRFWTPYIALENILVIMNFYSDDIHEVVHPEITFTLSEKGYPENHQTIYEMCPDLEQESKLDGDYFNELTKKTEDG